MLKVYLPGAFDQHLAQMDESPASSANKLERYLQSTSAITWRTTSC